VRTFKRKTNENYSGTLKVFANLPVAIRSVLGNVAKALIQRGSWFMGSTPCTDDKVWRGFFLTTDHKEICLRERERV